MKRLMALSGNMGMLLGLGVISFFTQKVAIFIMLGVITLMLFNICINLEDIINK